VKITYDPKKNEKNIKERDLSFDRADEFDLANATIEVDARKDDGEMRKVAIGFLDERLHVLGYVERGADWIHVFSFRKANKREARKYGKAKTTDR
jgi:uncharacterized DUF497 family protein